MSLQTTDTDKAAKVFKLAAEQLELERRIENGELLLEQLKNKRRIISEIELPDAMSEIEMKELVLKDGSRLKVEAYYSASIPKDRQGEAFEWLRKNGHGSLVKHDVTCSFGKEQDDLAAGLMEILREHKFEFSDKEAVNAQTLKAFVREQVEDGAALPLDLLGAHIGQRTIIKKG